MKATDKARAVGAVIGKALQPLNNGTGMVPILVAQPEVVRCSGGRLAAKYTATLMPGLRAVQAQFETGGPTAELTPLDLGQPSSLA